MLLNVLVCVCDMYIFIFIFVFRASIINITLALRTTKYLLHEREYIPWQAALRNLNYFFQLFDRSEVYGAMQVGQISS